MREEQFHAAIGDRGRCTAASAFRRLPQQCRFGADQCAAGAVSGDGGAARRHGFRRKGRRTTRWPICRLRRFSSVMARTSLKRLRSRCRCCPPRKPVVERLPRRRGRRLAADMLAQQEPGGTGRNALHVSSVLRLDVVTLQCRNRVAKLRATASRRMFEPAPAASAGGAARRPMLK